MLEEQPLKSSVSRQIDLGVIGRIEVEKREALHLCVSVKGIALDRSDPVLRSLLCALRVEFDAVPVDRCTVCNGLDRSPGSYTRINC
jgi:hypothetical protein